MLLCRHQRFCVCMYMHACYYVPKSELTGLHRTVFYSSVKGRTINSKNISCVWIIPVLPASSSTGVCCLYLRYSPHSVMSLWSVCASVIFALVSFVGKIAHRQKKSPKIIISFVCSAQVWRETLNYEERWLILQYWLLQYIIWWSNPAFKNLTLVLRECWRQKLTFTMK